MPIRPENKARYPKDWREISRRIRFERAAGQCECLGECGRGTHNGRCPNVHGGAAYGTGSKVVLTVAHLDHTPENCDDTNLKAMCQGCHLHLDREHHKETAAATRRAAIAASGQLALEAANQQEKHMSDPKPLKYKPGDPVVCNPEFQVGRVTGYGPDRTYAVQYFISEDELTSTARDTCDVCQQKPEDSGAQYDMALITWHGSATVAVCSNCIHGNPISIVDLHKAVSSARARDAALHLLTRPAGPETVDIVNGFRARLKDPR